MKKITRILLAFICLSCTSASQAQIPDNAEDISPLLTGETIPNATLIATAGEPVDLKEIIGKKPTILVFYRGGWCPYCNLQLSGLAKIETEIIDLGYQILAISPDDYQNLKSTESQDSIKYTLLSDPNGNFIQQMGIAFKTPTLVKGFIATKGQKGKVSDVIPAPAVFILNEEGSILFEYINPNYKQRISSEMLLAVLKVLRNS